LDLDRVTTYLPEDSCSCRHGGAERLLPDGREDPHGASLDWISELPESEG